MSKLANRKTQIYEAWAELVNTGAINTSVVRPVIAQSWKRSLSLGIDPKAKRPIKVCTGDIELILTEKNKLIEIAIPVMKDLYQLVQGSGFVVVLADEKGNIIETTGDEDVRESAKRGNLVIGGNWSEMAVGTNAIGTALWTGRSLQVFAAEHYWIGSHEWTCSAAPIRNPFGEITGVLNMSGTFEKVHPHTLGMVVAAANAIENLLRINLALEKLAIADEYKNTIIETMAEGILTVDHSGKLTQMNLRARQILELPNGEFLDRPVAEVLGGNHPLVEIMLNGRSRVDEEIYLETSKGTIHCTVTCRPIRTEGKHVGVVAILQEIKNIRQLVHKMVGAEAKFTFNDLIGKSPAFQNIVENARIAATSMSNVLLLGESGTGKELFAQAMHNASLRRRGPFVAVNCAALPRELVGSELFGYTEGAFTGAKRGGSPGKFELAEGGTLFLDEIGEMPLEMQAFLLRALQEKQITRIGGQKVIPVDVRVIAATNKNLWDEITKGTFRQDLFFRLNVFTINIMPLRERKEDIAVLVNFFVDKLGQRMGKQVKEVDLYAMEKLINYPWPGNVRELENVLERAINLSRGKTIMPENFPEYITGHGTGRETNLSMLAENERELIVRFLQMCNGNLSSVAKKLGISRPTLYSKLKNYNIEYRKL